MKLKDKFIQCIEEEPIIYPSILIFLFCLFAGTCTVAVKNDLRAESIPRFTFKEYNVSGYLLISPTQKDSLGIYKHIYLPPGSILNIPVPSDTTDYSPDFEKS